LTQRWVIVHADNGGHDFTGYDELSDEVTISRYRKVITKDSEYFQVVMNKTPFYAESGGQVGDRVLLLQENGRPLLKIRSRRMI